MGALIYEEYGSDEMVLSFFQAECKKRKAQKLDNYEWTLEHPQQPVNQSWIVDYPLLAYKTFTPRNREIAILHLA
jgi:hypothetical protein